MSKEPKNIWKKSLRGPRFLLTWLALLLLIVVAFFIFGLVTNNFPPHSDFADFLILFIFAAIGSLILLALWAFIRWIFCWRNFKRFLFGSACLATLIALFYAEEDWRGKHDWEKFKREWEAKGEKFDFKDFVPPPVPDDQNFAFSPVWIAEEKYTFQKSPERAKAWYGDRIYSEEVSKIFPLLPVSESGLVGTNWYSQSHLPNQPQGLGNWAAAQAMNLKPWQSYYRDLEITNPSAQIPVASQPQTPAQDVLLALSKFDPVIEQLRQDSARPDSRFPLQYDGMPAAILLPHLAAEKRYAQVLQLRSVAELQNGESKKALDDVKLSLRLADASRTEPFLISHLVRIAILQITLQPVYEGLAEHKWSDAQLTDLDSELAKLDFLADYQSMVRGERNLDIANIEFIRHPHDLDFKRPRLYFLAPFFSSVQMLSILSGEGDEKSQMDFQMLALGFGPSGWLDQNKLRIARFETKWYLPVVDKDIKTISPAKVDAASDEFNREMQPRTPENWLEKLLMPALSASAKKFSSAQSSVNLARVAVALERYRLANGSYPNSLDALAPQFMKKIPHDVINGQPLHYRRTDGGQFILYSVGWNEKDDGGMVGLTSNGQSVDNRKGDWVWRYPQK